jgi:hypothetical protein
MIPSAKIEKRDKAEPENRFNRPRIELPRPPEPKKSWIDCELTPGAGMKEPRRYSARIRPVNMTRRRSSGTRHALASHENT